MIINSPAIPLARTFSLAKFAGIIHRLSSKPFLKPLCPTGATNQEYNN